MPFAHTKIKQLLANRGLSLTAAAKQIGIRQQELSSIVCGRRPNPTLATLEKIAKVCDIAPAELIRSD